MSMPLDLSHANLMSLRAGQRFGLALPLTVGGMEGETHDISESGILFETDAEPKVGARIDLTLRYSMHRQKWQHRCQAQVVRVERIGAKVNVAAQLLWPLHESNLSS